MLVTMADSISARKQKLSTVMFQMSLAFKKYVCGAPIELLITYECTG